MEEPLTLEHDTGEQPDECSSVPIVDDDVTPLDSPAGDVMNTPRRVVA
jgi:hypothetical protein